MHLGFPRRTLTESGLFKGLTDYHSHFLPGVDDGFQTTDQSLKALQIFEDLGVREVWLTPHIMEDFPNPTDVLRQRFAAFSAAYTEKAGRHPVRLHLAAEYMLDSLFVQRLNTGDLLPFIDEQHLLVETSYYNPPFGFDELLGEIRERGYLPVLAHPERYHYMSMRDYKQLYDKAILFQLDVFSLLGAYGQDAAEKSRSLLDKGWYDWVGSDIHELDSFTEWMDVPIKRRIVRSLVKWLKN